MVVTVGKIGQALEVLCDLGVDKDAGGNFASGEKRKEDLDKSRSTIEIAGQWGAVEEVPPHTEMGGDGGL